MAIWFWLALASNVVVWSIFFYLLSRRHWNVAALIVGILHMLFSVVLSVAPFRSFLDPHYPGLGLGFLRLKGLAVTLPATLIFGWAVAAAWLAISKGRGRWMTLIVVGDIFLALNFGGSTLLEGRSDNWRIDFGEGRSITGLASAFILLLFFTFPFVASAIWAARRSRSNGTAPPLTSDLQEKRSDTEDDTNDINSFCFSESGV
ncbi:MAG: hypothetical protein AUG51_25510 [Acidobacteria bacterium 13_1_20CM_3_53_8]|nr:MAG: hypothetical protein AUG51_25510 [Acidobacteria bacterium 13_1_20CM_3_53_8]